MKMKQLCVITSLSSAFMYGATMVKPDNFEYIKSIPNIFEDQNIAKALKNAMNETNKSIDMGLKENRSDTLKKSYLQIKSAGNRIMSELSLFNSNLPMIKTDSMVLDKLRKDAQHFSQDRDKLKQEIAKLETFKKQNEKALLRSSTKKDAKADIADMLIDYAQTFIVVAQKAINDFATIDAALFKKEKMATVKPVTPPTQNIAVARPMSTIVTPPTDVENIIMPTNIDDELTDAYMVTPALTDMPQKKGSYLMEDSDAAFIKQQSQRQQSGVFRPIDTSRMSDTWAGWDSTVE